MHLVDRLNQKRSCLYNTRGLALLLLVTLDLTSLTRARPLPVGDGSSLGGCGSEDYVSVTLNPHINPSPIPYHLPMENFDVSILTFT